MLSSIATVSLGGSLEERLSAAAAAGFDAVELFEDDLICCPRPPEEVAALARELRLVIDLYQPFRDFEAVPEDLHRRNLRRAEHKFEVMRRLDVSTMLVCSNVSPTAIDDDGLAAAQLHALAELGAQFGIRIAYEALAWGRHVSDYLHSWRIAEAARHPNLGLCLDSFHVLTRGVDPIGSRRAVAVSLRRHAPQVHDVGRRRLARDERPNQLVIVVGPPRIDREVAPR